MPVAAALRGAFGGAALSLICGGEWGSGSVADPWSVALSFLQVFKTGGGAAPAACSGGGARAAGTGEAAKPPSCAPGFVPLSKHGGVGRAHRSGEGCP